MCIFVLLRFQIFGGIELNPGSNKWKQNNLSIFHWNLNRITAHNFLKFFKLKAYISTYKPDFLCLSETYLHSSTPSNIIDIEGYKLVCLDHPFNVKRDGVCIYYKENLPGRVINLLFLKKHCFQKCVITKKSVCVRNLSFPKPRQ